jgi:hypothetical protein
VVEWYGCTAEVDTADDERWNKFRALIPYLSTIVQVKKGLTPIGMPQ